MPLQRRIPKFGFKNRNRVEYKGINLDVLQALAEKTKAKEVNIELLHTSGLIGKNDLVKVLGRGDLKAKLSVTAHAFSATAAQAIEAAGGSVTKL
jgi:large subunit ribosomal protein L15